VSGPIGGHESNDGQSFLDVRPLSDPNLSPVFTNAGALHIKIYPPQLVMGGTNYGPEPGMIKVWATVERNSVLLDTVKGRVIETFAPIISQSDLITTSETDTQVTSHIATRIIRLVKSMVKLIDGMARGHIILSKEIMGSEFKIERPPGTFILHVANFLCTKKTRERVVEPLVSDFQMEIFEALHAGRIWKARWMHIHFIISFIMSIVGDGVLQLICRIISKKAGG
jgi:hypothetical protein